MHTRKPLWLYPSMISLDTPMVAMAWLYVFAKAWRVNYLPWTAYAVLAMAIWVIHVMERLSDLRAREIDGVPIDERGHFLRCHAGIFRMIVILVMACVLAMIMVFLPVSIFNYLFFGAVLVAGFFVVSRISRKERHEIAYSKNILAGTAFAYGIAMFAHVFLPAVGPHELIRTSEYLFFVVLCVIWFCAIDFWRKSAHDVDAESGSNGDLAITMPVLVLAVATLAFAISSHQQSVRPFYYAILTGIALIHVINRNRRKFNAIQSRLLADLGMLAPALVFHAYPPT